MSEAIVFTSGKGGVGKTTTIANIGAGLSLLDKKVILLDTDVGLRNLDVVMGLEDRINYNLFDILEHHCSVKQAIIKDKRFPNLFFIPGTLRIKNVQAFESAFHMLIRQLKQEYDYILIDCPAGIDQGFHFATSAADRAILITTPHISAIRDAGRTLYMLEALSLDRIFLLVNEYDEKMIRKKELLSRKDIEDILEMPVFGCVPYDRKIIISQNQGVPLVTYRSRTSEAYIKLAKRLILEPSVHCTDKERQYEAL